MTDVHFVVEHMSLPTPSSVHWLVEFVRSSRSNAQYALSLAEQYYERRFGRIDFADEKNSQYLDELYVWYSKLDSAGLVMQDANSMKLGIAISDFVHSDEVESPPYIARYDGMAG